MESPAPAQTPQKVNWFSKHKALTSFLILFLVVISALAFRTTQNQAVAGIATSIAPTAAIPTNTPTSTPTDTPEPSPTQAPTPATVYVAPTRIIQIQPTTTDTSTSTGTQATSDRSAPADATAKCGDGTYSYSQHRSGTCSHHQGVAAWL